MKTGESGLTVFRLLTKDNRWKWVQANARLVYKNGKPEYIVVTQRPLVYVPGRGQSLAFSMALGCPEQGRMLDLLLLLVPFKGAAVGFSAWCCSAASLSARLPLNRGDAWFCWRCLHFLCVCVFM